MSGEERNLQLAELRAEQEREASIGEARSVVRSRGTDDCLDCGDPIAVDRKIAAPWSTRCLDCQMFHEQEKRYR